VGPGGETGDERPVTPISCNGIGFLCEETSYTAASGDFSLKVESSNGSRLQMAVQLGDAN